MTEPVTLSQIKQHLRIEEDVTDEDAMLSAMIVAARRACEGRINRSIVGASAAVRIDAFPILPPTPIAAGSEALDVDLPGGVVSTVSAITYLTESGVQTLDPALYRAALGEVPARVSPVDAWPVAQESPEAIVITYVISPMSVDDLAVVTQAIKLIVGSWYRNREATAVDQKGSPVELPLSVTWLLGPLRQFATS